MLNDYAMKKLSITLRCLAAAFGLALVPAAALAQLNGEVVVSSSPAQGAQFPEVAYYNNVVHVVWVGYENGKAGDIFYARSTNGTSFSVPVNLSANATASVGNDRPQVTAGPTGVWVGWNSDNNTGAIYVRRSTNDGLSFNAAQVVAGAEGGLYSRITHLFTDSAGVVHLAYYTNEDTAGASGQVHHRMACNGTWGADVAVTNRERDGDFDNEQPRIGEAAGRLYVAFRSSRLGSPQGGWAPYSIHFQTGSKSGCTPTWSYPARHVAGGLPRSYHSTSRPEVVVDGSGVAHLTWFENLAGYNAYYRRGALAAGTLLAPTKLSNFTVDHLEPGGISATPATTRGGFQAPPGFATNGTKTFIAYSRHDTVTSSTFENGPVYYRESNDGGASWGGETLLTTSNAGTTPRIAFNNSGGNAAFVWSDIRAAYSGTPRILFRLYGTPSGGASTIQTLITSYYQTILGRAPDPGGVEFWEGEAARVQALGADIREVFFALAVQFFNTPEYLAKNRDTTGYLTDLYQTFFSRSPDAEGMAYWQSQVAGGMDRGALLTNFLFSTEFSNTMTALFGTSNPRAEINMLIDLYRGILGNLPDSAGFNYWLGRIRAAQCAGGDAVNAEVTAISQLFLGSEQYVAIDAARPPADRNRMFVGDLYNAFLRRGADLPGYNFWVGQLNSSAMFREQVRAQYVSSPEFQARVQAVIAQGCFGG